MKILNKRLLLSFFLVLLALPFAVAQSFSVATNLQNNGNSFVYNFTFNYDQLGDNQQLTDPVWDWGFYIDPTESFPTDISTPTGWKWSYDSVSGDFNFYTEGPGGWVSGDFGSNVISPGQSLAGFSIDTNLAPVMGSASGVDTQFNLDSNSALIPGNSAVPEPGLLPGLCFGIAGFCMFKPKKKLALH